MTDALEELRPGSADEVVSMVREAIASRTSIDIAGGGTRAGLGRPREAAREMSLSGFSGITLYEPAELVIGAKTGTPLALIEATLREHGQMLPFEPMDHRAIFGTTGEPTIGGVFAANVSGPRRISAGAARDHLLGVTLVNGRGQVVKNGGRVMKNVTGLDLVKLSGGAMGTLGVLTEVVLKVLPAPETAQTLVFDALDVSRAIDLMSAAMGSPFDVAAAAHLPDEGGAHKTLLRVEGFANSVNYRLASLRARLAEFGMPTIIGADEGEKLWRGVRDVTVLNASPTDEIWRVGLAPSKAAQIVASLPAIEDLRIMLDWAGGLIWIAAPAGAGIEGDFRTDLARLGGHATLVRADDERRRAVQVYQPLAAPLMALTKGIKASFDPDRLFNPGRMYEGI